LSEVNPRLQIVLTAGGQGSWSWDGAQLQHIPAIPVDLVNSAGAGDAYLAGTIVGLTASLSLLKAQQLANLVAALSATSPHTINFDIDRNSLAVFAGETNTPLSTELNRLLGIGGGR
jgi:sugar/nucleoside kinase (ribokinase family)